MSDIQLLPGDIVCTRGDSWISRIIRLFTRTYGEAPTRVNHCELVVNGGTLEDAEVVSADRHGVAIRTILPYHAGQWLTVWRPGPSSVLYAKRAAVSALSVIGEKYPVWRLVAHALDWIIGLGGAVDVYLFRRFMRSSVVMECSYLVAWAYEPWLSFGRPVPEISPDDIDDYCRYHPAVFAEVLPLQEV